jgi:2-C-methyl-D-erythritol 4-phosphate cytidylyltransferase
MRGVFNLKGRITDDDIVVISFGVSPMTPQADIDDSIRVCKIHGNGIAAVDIDLCTCIKDDEYSTTQNVLRETLKGFANPWSFKLGELCGMYDEAIDKGILNDLEPHTTSLYLALGKKLWFSQCTSPQCKITHKCDLDMFEGSLLLKEKEEGISYK